MVAYLKEALVWYNYDVGRKCDPGEDARGVSGGVWGRVEEYVDI